MTQVFGLPAVEVENPDGELVKYVLRPDRPRQPAELRAWVLVKEDGTEHRVVNLNTGRWACSCKDYFYRSRRDVAKNGRCKHIVGLVAHLEERQCEASPSASPKTTSAPGCGGVASGAPSTSH